MGHDDELRLNELVRFRKTSPGLALEAHSHCEVPAGCGGVVLRWRRAGAPVGLSFSRYIAREAEPLHLDGEELKEQRTEVEPGTHTLSFAVDHPGREGFVLLKIGLQPTIVTAQRPVLASAAGPGWRAAVTPPPAGWRVPDFDDSTFVTLVERAVPRPKEKPWSWEFLHREVAGLGLPPSGDGRLAGIFDRGPPRAWVRLTFKVDHRGFS
jgi:hypothetical protein